jgi:hypothetical protein
LTGQSWSGTLPDPTNPSRVATLTGFTDAVVDVDFFGGSVIAVDQSGDARIWKIDSLRQVVADPVARACAVAGPELPAETWATYVPDQPEPTLCD